MRVLLPSLLLVTLSCFQPGSADASQSLTLAWSPSPDPSVVGYNIYSGLTNHVFDHKVSVAGANSVTIAGLLEGNTYYFVATAYNAAGLESLPTGEISYTVPGARLTVTQTKNGVASTIQIASANLVRASWTLQSSPDLKTWSTLSTGSNSAVQVTVSNTFAPAAYFRLTTP